MFNLKLSSQTLDVASCLAWVQEVGAGAINVFIGTVRDQTAARKVLRLEFEAYEQMAIKEMTAIAEESFERWQLKRILIHHRTGILNVGEIPVVIAVSSPHRAEAFEACRYIIDTLKKRVPIWKKEVYDDGETWVSATP